jgi:hypothetical protein
MRAGSDFAAPQGQRDFREVVMKSDYRLEGIPPSKKKQYWHRMAWNPQSLGRMLELTQWMRRALKARDWCGTAEKPEMTKERWYDI